MQTESESLVASASVDGRVELREELHFDAPRRLVEGRVERLLGLVQRERVRDHVFQGQPARGHDFGCDLEVVDLVHDGVALGEYDGLL